jgi:trans-aconitate methyltransferase
MSPIPNAHGFLEYMDERETVFDVRGWMLDRQGPFDAVLLEGVGQGRSMARAVEREDLVAALPAIPGARAAGFHVEVVRELLPNAAEVPLRLVGMRAERPVAVLAGAFYRCSRDVAFPSRELMRRVAATDLDYLFRAGGMKGCWDLTHRVWRHLPRARVRKVLDWGCGPARVTRHLLALLPEAEIHGTDVDAEAVAWSARALPEAHFRPCGLEPPLDYPDGCFDLVLGGSVFTHLQRELQLRWLAELARVLAPGGLLIATTLGEFAVRHRLTQPPAGLARDGIDDSERDPALRGVAPPEYYRATYQTQAYTAAAWSRVFDALDFDSGGYMNIQDLWVLRRR